MKVYRGATAHDKAYLGSTLLSDLYRGEFVSAAAVGTPWDATWNPTHYSFANGNYDASRDDTSARRTLFSASSKTTGKYYWEVHNPDGHTIDKLGLSLIDESLRIYRDGNDLYNSTSGAGITNGLEFINSVLVSRFAWDADAGLFWVADDAGNWNVSATADPATGTEGIDVSDMIGSAVFIYLDTLPQSDPTKFLTLATRSSDFTYTAPAGFSTWHDE